MISEAGHDIDAAALYAALCLRAEVFVVEQDCPYLDPDGRDLEPGVRHLWTPGPASYLRILDEGGGLHRIGRVVTAPGARGRGQAAALMARALELVGDGPVVLDAQAPLEGWYAGFGFARAGPPFVEDGIPHVPMRRAP